MSLYDSITMFVCLSICRHFRLQPRFALSFWHSSNLNPRYFFFLSLINRGRKTEWGTCTVDASWLKIWYWCSLFIPLKPRDRETHLYYLVFLFMPGHCTKSKRGWCCSKNPDQIFLFFTVDLQHWLHKFSVSFLSFLPRERRPNNIRGVTIDIKSSGLCTSESQVIQSSRRLQRWEFHLLSDVPNL